MPLRPSITGGDGVGLLNFTIMKAIPWKKILEIVIAILTAILGVIGVQSCIGSPVF